MGSRGQGQARRCGASEAQRRADQCRNVSWKSFSAPNATPLLMYLRNDCQNKQDPKQTARNMADMLDEIYQRWPDTTVILSTLVRSGSSDGAIVSCTAAVSQEY